MGNSTSLNELDPSEMLEPSSLKCYKETRDLVWQELIRLNSYLFVLDKLLHFPSDPSYLFLGPERQTFLSLVNISFTESSLLLITKLTTDTSKDLLSMPRFKNWVRRRVKQEYQKAFDRLLKENKFSKTVETSKENAKYIRNNLIAHLIVDENMRPKSSIDRISLQEVSLIASELNRLFDVLCFGHKHAILPLDYDPKVQHPVGSDSRSDIEYFLDLLIQDSHLFKMPEELQYWDIEMEALPLEIVNILNEYRRKFGKPEV